tara:strand:+ start:1891 stop:2076 length:186 start_codon:yes stop_codon:yes gene_type:complete
MKYKNTGGLTIKNGRLINDRPMGMTGIQQAANIKQAMKKVEKVNMIADGIELAEGRKGFYR